MGHARCKAAKICRKRLPWVWNYCVFCDQGIQRLELEPIAIIDYNHMTASCCSAFVKANFLAKIWQILANIITFLFI